MTNKEAIEHLRELKTLRIEFPNSLQEQALDLAIKVLEEVKDISEVEGYCDTCKHNDGYPTSEVCQWCGAFHHYERNEAGGEE